MKGKVEKEEEKVINFTVSEVNELKDLIVSKYYKLLRKKYIVYVEYMTSKDDELKEKYLERYNRVCSDCDLYDNLLKKVL